MARTKFGKRIAIIQAYYINKELRGGTIVFAGEEDTKGTPAKTYACQGYTFVTKYRETDYGDTFGGYVSSPKMDKDDEYPPADFYVNLNPYTGENENIAYMVSVTEVDDGEFGEKIFGGILYKSSNLKGFTSGFISTLIVEDEEEEDTPKSRSKSGSSSRQQSSRRKRGSDSEEEPQESKTSTRSKRGSRSTSKKTDEQEEDVPLY